MGFKIKGSNEILEKLINWVSTQTDKITDFNIGTAIRTLLESVSLQIEEFYFNLKRAVEYAIKESAYEAFNFEKKGAREASGYVTIFFDGPLKKDLVIDQGTNFDTGDRKNPKAYYESVERVIVSSGSERASIKVVCTKKGEIGNCNVADICNINPSKPNIKYVANLEKFGDGVEKESEAERALRFKEYVHSLQRGTKEALAYGVKQVDGVAGVFVDDSFIGFVRIFAHDRNGNLPDELLKKIYEQVELYRAAGIEVEVTRAVIKEVSLSFKIFYKDSYSGKTYDEMIKNLIKDFIDNLRVGERLSVSSLISYIYDNYMDIIDYLEIDSYEDIEANNNELIIAKDIKVNEG